MDEKQAKVVAMKTTVKETPKAGEKHEVKGWFVEVLEDNSAKVVVYEKARMLYEFPNEESCDKFLEELRKENKGSKFRKVQRDVIHTFGEW